MYNFFIMIFDILIFGDILSRYIPFVQYFDEIITLSIIFLSSIKLFNKKLNISTVEMKSIIFFLLFIFIGVLGSIVHRIQPYSIAVFKDIFAISKFIICYIGTLTLSNGIDKEKILNGVYKHAKFFISVFFVFGVINSFTYIGMGNDIRHGIRSYQFLYIHPTFLVATTIIIICVLIAKGEKENKFFILQGLIVLVLTFRSKAIMFILCYFIATWFKRFIEKFKIKYIVYILLIGIVVFKDKILYYTHYGLSSARTALYIIGYRLAVKYFPLGSGFGTFASSISGKYYSPIYKIYNISDVIGLRPGKTNYIADTFWPYIYGQFGIIGFILFVMVIICIVESLRERYSYNYSKIKAAMLLFLYVLIASTAEAVFTNTTSVEVFIVLAIFLGKSTSTDNKGKEFLVNIVNKIRQFMSINKHIHREEEIQKLLKLIRNPIRIVPILGAKGFLNVIPDKVYLELMYRAMIGKKLDLKKPKTFNEKLQWLKLYDRKPLYTILADKYEVRKYIEKTIGDEYLIPLIGVYDKFEEINFSQLPNQFVLKCTHDSGSVFICTDKSKFDIEKVREKINKALKRNYYYFAREWPYKNVKPRIICEKFISDKNTTPDDYKVLCFNGRAKLIGVHIDRFGNHCLDNYDREWNKTIIAKDGPMSDMIYDKPKQFDNMILLSEKLAANMYHVRIDWFIINNKLYFGEVTFFEAAGYDNFDNKDDDFLLGRWIKLPIENDN